MDQNFVEYENICRTCLLGTENGNLKSIFKAGMLCGEVIKLSDMLTLLTHVEYYEEESVPNKMCMKCVIQLSKAFVFCKQVLKSNEVLNEKNILIKNEETVSEMAAHDDVLNIEEEEPVDEFGHDEDQELYAEKIEMQDETSYMEHEPQDEYHVVEITTNSDEKEDEEYNACEIDADHYTIENVIVESGIETIMSNESINSIKKCKARGKSYPDVLFKCEVCGKILRNHSSYKYHMQLHSDATPFLCSECGEKFKTRNAYDGHMTTHNPNNPNRCNLCGKTYRQSGSLRSHMLTHTGQKPFLCGICGKGMTQKSGFKKHMLTHTGQKPFSCDICGKEFRYSSNLITHKRGHTGSRPYKCEVCDKSFIGSEQLKRHSIIHTGLKPFECKICEKAFNRKSSLIVHQSIHVTNKNDNFECGVCGENYSNMDELNCHLNTHKEDATEEVVL